MSLRSWGNYPKFNNKVYTFKNHETIAALYSENDSFIPFGNGRSYGDSALNRNILDMRSYDFFLGFDSKTGILHCQAGVLLSDILNVFIPKGWFLSITPGTKYITVGGAIASDVHGKNHHIAGSFSDSIVSFTLSIPSGEIKTCSTNKNSDLFNATCGGMGLTGIILDVKLKLKPIATCFINQKIIKTNNLEETFREFERSKKSTYSVAWIDCLATNAQIGKSLLMTGEHSNEGYLGYRPKTNLTIPLEMPTFLLNKYSVKTFNFLYYNKINKKEVNTVTDIDHFFYPLDSINYWNRIYGKNGFTQYQFVLPLKSSYIGLKHILRVISQEKKGSFLSVLKLFGKGNSNWLSFPMEGYTLALDFKIEPGLFLFLKKLDEIVVEYGGKIYLAKDVRVDRRVFEKGYPLVNKFREFRIKNKLHHKLSSLQSERLEI